MLFRLALKGEEVLLYLRIAGCDGSDRRIFVRWSQLIDINQQEDGNNFELIVMLLKIINNDTVLCHTL